MACMPVLAIAETEPEIKADSPPIKLASLGAATNEAAVILSLEQLMNVRVMVRKREEDPFDIPVSLTVITEQEIDQLGVKNYLQLERYIPNTDAGIIRGIPSFSGSIAQDAGNSVYVDGVYIRGAASIYDLVDLNRVEVIRGPQAILFGRNTMTGAINYETNKPQSTTTNRWRLKLGNDEIIQLGGASNIAFTDTFYARLSLSLDQRQGYYHNRFDATDLNNSDRVYGRLQLRWLASDKITTNLSLDKARTSSRNIQGILRQPSTTETQDALDYWSAVAGLTPQQTLTSSYTVHQDTYRDPFIREFWNGIFALEYRFDDLHEFTYTGARRAESSSLNSDDDDRFPVFLISSPDHEKSDTTSHEFRFNGEYDRWNWVSGIYLEQISGSGEHEVLVSELGVNAFIALSGLPAQDESVHAFYNAQVDVESRAIYGNINYSISEDLIITTGLRYTVEEKDLSFRQYGGCWTNPTGSITVLFGGCFYPQLDVENSQEDDGTSAILGLSYYLNANTMFYASISNGFRSSGFNAAFLQIDALAIQPGLAYSAETVTDLDLTFDSEDTESLEFGVKFRSPDRAYSVSLGLFLSQYKNFVVPQLIGGGFDLNTGEASLMGAELDLEWFPFEDFKVTARVGLLDAEYKKFVDADDDFKGNKLTGSPRWSYSLLLTYLHRLNDSFNVISSMDYSYIDERFSGPANDINTNLIEDNALLNMRIGMETQDAQYGVYLWGKNITAEEYETNVGIFDALGLEQASLSQPYSYGIELLINF